jgi:hypothetical protein
MVTYRPTVGLFSKNKLGRICKEVAVAYYPGMEDLKVTNWNLDQGTGVPVEIWTRDLLTKSYKYTSLLIS